jgi:hypothetical protein
LLSWENQHGGDENTPPSVGKDQPQDLKNHRLAAPGSHRPIDEGSPTDATASELMRDLSCEATPRPEREQVIARCQGTKDRAAHP